MSKLVKLIKSWFAPATYKSELEQFIVSRNPQNNAHVEALEREYESIQFRGTWGRA